MNPAEPRIMEIRSFSGLSVFLTESVKSIVHLHVYTSYLQKRGDCNSSTAPPSSSKVHEWYFRAPEVFLARNLHVHTSIHAYILLWIFRCRPPIKYICPIADACVVAVVAMVANGD